MNISAVVDASVWVSWLITSDTNHDASLLWIDNYIAKGGFLVAPEFMLVEVAASLSRQIGNPELAKETVKNLEVANETSIIPMNKALINAAISVASAKTMLSCFSFLACQLK